MLCKDCYHKPKVGDTFKEDKISYDSNGVPYNKEFKIVDIKASETTKHQIKANSPNEIPRLLREAEKVFNAYIRKRDSFEGRFICISSGEELDVKFMQAGHFYPKTYSSLRFNEDNVHGESTQANCMDINHLEGYKINLINKIGITRYNALNEVKNVIKKWDKQELLEIIKKYK